MIPSSLQVEKPWPFVEQRKGIQSSPPHLQQEEWIEQSRLLPAMNKHKKEVFQDPF